MESAPADLAALQRWMQAVISHPAGIVAGLQSDEARREFELAPEDAEWIVARGPEQTSIERLAVYGNAFFARLIECLQNSFPITSFLTGERIFGLLAVGYLVEHPSTSYTLDRLADRFVEHLRASRLRELSNVERSSPVQSPDFTELVIEMARLEKAIEEIFDGPGMEGTSLLSIESLQQLGEANWPLARLKLAPCARLLKFNYPVSDYFTAARAAMRSVGQHAADFTATSADGTSQPPAIPRPPLPLPAASYLLLARQDWIVVRIPLSATQHRLLELIEEGRPIGEAIAGMMEGASESERAVAERQLGDWFRRWAMLGIFAEIVLPPAVDRTP